MLDRENQRGTPRGYCPHTSDPIACVARVPRPVENPREFLVGSVYKPIFWKSAVGHEDVARLFSTILNLPVEVNRVSVKLINDDFALIGQYVGPRLPEGATQLPEGATIEWWVV